jgi:hydroxymethylbilane synthase
MTSVHSPRRLVIATRESALALWQAEHIRARLGTLYPHASIELLGVTTQGDRVQDRPLAAIGGKGLFIKELEIAMAEGRADLAVHSLKDVPMDIPDGYTLAAVAAREDPHDAFVSNRHDALELLPDGAIVGTSSLRREAQLRERFPKLVVEPLRGNVNTRLRKLDEGRYDAIILAAAGLKRLGFGHRIRGLIEPDDSLPRRAGRAGDRMPDRSPDVVAALAPLADVGTTLATTAERAFSRALSGSCHTPLAAYAEWEEGRLWLRGLVATRDGRNAMRGELEGEIEDAEAAATLGVELADDFLARGAARFVATN